MLNPHTSAHSGLPHTESDVATLASLYHSDECKVHGHLATNYNLLNLNHWKTESDCML